MPKTLGSNMNMETFSKLAAPATTKLRQLQKMVQDIKKNDGSLLDKLKSRFTSKSTPKLPARDYQGLSGSDVDGDEQWSEAEFEEDTYEDLEDHDDNYEPPPSHSHFTPTPSASFHRGGEYVDSRRERPDQPPRKPLRPAKNTKPLPPAPSQMSDDEDDYINPEGANDDDYINPTEKSPPNPMMHRTNRAVQAFVSKPVPERPPSPDVYEVPDQEESSSLVNRIPLIPPKPSHPLPPLLSPRMNIRQSPLPVPEPLDVDKYEVCDPNDRSSIRSVNDRPPVALKPRDLLPKPAFRPKPELMDRDDGPLIPMRHDNPKLPVKPSITDFKRPKIPIPHFLTPNRPPDKGSVSTENGPIDTEKEEDLHRKPWYAGDCDRKTAEDALLWSNKDGSFLVRQSSGHDTQQPYTLAVLYNDRVYNIPVRFIPATLQYALGREKKGEERFSSVSHMIESHQRNPLVLIDTQSHNKDATKLCYAVRP